MKRFLFAILFTAVLALPAAADEPGEIEGYVSTSDIVVTIDGIPIRSYNKDGDSYIVAEELREHGIRVTWDDTGYGTLVVHALNEAKSAVTSTYDPENETETGEIPYYHSHILTYIDNTPVEALNIGGKTLIRMDDLARFWQDDVRYSETDAAWVWDAYLWDSDTNTLNLRTRDHGTDSAWWRREWWPARGFTTADTEHDWYTAIDFSFDRADGLYMYANIHGDATTVGHVELRGDRLIVTFADDPSEAGAAIRDKLLAKAIDGSIGEKGSALWRQYEPTAYTGLDGIGIYPADYRSYRLHIPENAWILHDLCFAAGEHFHVAVNGEEQFGIVYRVGDDQLVFRFEREYAEYEIESLIVELNLGVG